MTRNFLSIAGETPESFGRLIERAAAWKAQVKSGRVDRILGATDAHTSPRTVAMLFQKPSNRTRVSCEMALHHLGGRALYLSPQEIGLGKRESTRDVAAVLGRYVDGILARVYSHADVLELAEHAGVPVVNGLSDHEHPCQALGDFLTMREQGWKPGSGVLSFVGDGNNVAHSLMIAAALTGTEFRWIGPEKHRPGEQVLACARQLGARIVCSHDMIDLKGSDFVYTDVWASMGFENEAEERKRTFRAFQLNAKAMASCPGAKVLHCLPAHRGDEITDEVLDGPNSVVLDQAENRVYSKMAVFEQVLAG